MRTNHFSVFFFFCQPSCRSYVLCTHFLYNMTLVLHMNSKKIPTGRWKQLETPKIIWSLSAICIWLFQIIFSPRWLYISIEILCVKEVILRFPRECYGHMKTSLRNAARSDVHLKTFHLFNFNFYSRALQVSSFGSNFTILKQLESEKVKIFIKSLNFPTLNQWTKFLFIRIIDCMIGWAFTPYR